MKFYQAIRKKCYNVCGLKRGKAKHTGRVFQKEEATKDRQHGKREIKDQLEEMHDA